MPEIERERAAFFHTRVTGRPEIWQTLRVALDVLWSGGDDMDNDGGVATAQQILSAAEITVPSGDLADGAYDSFGAFYSLPEHIVSDPVDIMATECQKAADEADEDSGDTKEAPMVEESQTIRPEDRVSVRARRSDGVVKDIVITASKKDSIQVLSAKFTAAAKVSQAKYLGNVLTDGLEASTAKASQASIYGQTIASRRVSRNRRMGRRPCPECIDF